MHACTLRFYWWWIYRERNKNSGCLHGMPYAFKVKQTIGSEGTPHKLQILGVQIPDTDDFMQRAFQFGGLLWPMLGL
jgi:hypothetical protein